MSEPKTKIMLNHPATVVGSQSLRFLFLIISPIKGKKIDKDYILTLHRLYIQSEPFL